jgi:hypothetical protein
VTSRILLLSGRSIPTSDPDAGLLEEALRERGAEVLSAPWDEPRYPPGIDLSVIRTPWDYFERHVEFLDRIRATERTGRIVNTADTVAWNSHKGYLLDLARRGVPVVATTLVPRGSTTSVLEDALRAAGDVEVVIKPAVSICAIGALRTHARDAGALAHLRGLVRTGDALVQPFEPLVTTEGELSLMYFGGRFSHAVLKTAKAGDYRVQADHGGMSELFAEVTEAQRAVAERAIAAAPRPPVYARVDLVRPADPVVMELELIEPELFLRHDPASATRFAGTLLDLT